MQVSTVLITHLLTCHKNTSKKNRRKWTNIATYTAEPERAVGKDLIALLSITDGSILQFHC